MHRPKEELLRRILPVNDGDAAAHNPVPREDRIKALMKHLTLRESSHRWQHRSKQQRRNENPYMCRHAANDNTNSRLFTCARLR